MQIKTNFVLLDPFINIELPKLKIKKGQDCKCITCVKKSRRKLKQTELNSITDSRKIFIT